MEKCRKCNQNKPQTAFKQLKNGTYTGACDTCREKEKIKAATRRQKQSEQKVPDGMQICTTCRKVLIIDNFKCTGSDKITKQCKECREKDKNRAKEKTENDNTKKCVRCKLEKALDQFPKAAKQCLRCKEIAKERRTTIKEKVSKMEIEDGNKLCNSCNKVYPIDEFKDRPTGGKTSHCIHCIQRMNEYLEKHKCEHGNKNKSACKECKGASICEHNRNRTYCMDCKGGSLCEHKKRKDRCEICEPLYGRHQYCEHNSLKTSCVSCNGGGICEHGTRRTRCIECNGGSICEHKIQRNRCKYCDYIGYFSYTVISKVHSRVRRNVTFVDEIDYLCCNIPEYRKYLESKFVDDMTWENYGKVWDIDHIVPIKYQNPTIQEVVKRLHYTNTQPLWKKLNASKGNRYSSELQQVAAHSGETVIPPSPELSGDTSH